jgi:hypothetical protein
VDAVVAQYRGLAGSDAVQGVDRELGEPVGGLVGVMVRTPPGGGIWAEAVAATVMDGPIPTRTSTPSREIERIRRTSPSRCAVVP